jgi:tetratricopeptide (TPR) repeat protein
MRRWFFAILGLNFSIQAFAELSASPEDLFQKGLSAYQNKQFEEARTNFFSIYQEGRLSAPLFHNLALTYFQLDKKPFAMAFWRKALAVDPSFKPAAAGRKFLESRFNMSPWEKDTFSLWFRRTMESVSLYEISWLIAFLLGSAGWMWIRYLAARKIAVEDEQPKPPFPSIAAGLSVILIGALILVGLKFQLMNTVRATVVQDKVSARSLPAEDGVGLFDLQGGAEVVVRRRQNQDWFQVQNSDGASGWLKKDEILLTDERKRL